MKIIFIISFFVLLFDQLTKHFFKNKTILFTDFFKFDYVENTGAAFGLLKGFNPLFIVVAFAVLFFIFKYYKEIKQEKLYMQIAIGFLIGGILGNLIDRIFLGYVIDFISFSFWPTFNLADTFSTLAVILLSFQIFTKK